VFEPRLVRAGRGWLRVELRGWSGGSPAKLARRVERIHGVRAAAASSQTRRLFVRFEPGLTDERDVLAALAIPPPLDTPEHELESTAPSDVPPALVSRSGGVSRARIAVRGLERDARVAGRVVERLRRLPGVISVSASPLTGRVLVEFAEAETQLSDLFDEVRIVELPALPGEDRPAHPLDREPLVQSGSRLVGAAAGLGLLTARRIVGASGPPTSRRGPAEAAALLGVAEGFPALKDGARAAFGPRGAELAFAAATVLALTLSGSTLGLAVNGLGALRAFTETRERQRAWRRYERRVEHFPPVLPPMKMRVEGGERVPLAGEVVGGAGTAVAADGTLVRIGAGSRVEPGMRVHGASLVIAVETPRAFDPHRWPLAAEGDLLTGYLEAVPWLALAYVGLTLAVTRSLGRAFIAFVVVNPRAALATAEAADLNAWTRVLRAGVTVVGVRRRPLRAPDLLLIDGARPLTDGFELASVRAEAPVDPVQAVELGAKIAAACGSPWPRAFPAARVDDVADGGFDGGVATGTIGGGRFRLAQVNAETLEDETELDLELTREGVRLAVFALRSRAAPGLRELRHTCERLGIELRIVTRGALATGYGLSADDRDLLTQVRHCREAGRRVAVASDSAAAAAEFAEADLAVGLASGRSGRFSAQVDLLAPDLGALAAIVEAGARRERAVRDGSALALVGNAAGSVWALRRQPVLQRAAYPLYLSALAGFVVSWLRLRGGERPFSLATIADPRPERWGRLEPAEVMRAFETRSAGLSAREAATRRREELVQTGLDHRVLGAAAEQLRSPLTALLGIGAGLSYAVGSRADVAVIAAVVAVNCLVGAWQETEATAAAATLEQRTTAAARVRRGGAIVSILAAEVVAGDVLVLAAGDRVAADARLLDAQGLEVDEAPLTGESLPVVKQVDGGSAESHVLLAGCDVTVGSGEAVAVAVGRETRIGATATALELAGDRRGALDERLSRMLRQALPVSLAGGVCVLAGGFLWRRPLRPQLAVAASIAIAALPEGLPLLAGVAEAAVARRLARRQAFVRRLAAVEALGRVDVACVDKTGTLTEGRLAVDLVADGVTEGRVGPALHARLRRVLLAAALASPHPDAADARAHPTDGAILEAADAAGLSRRIRARRFEEAQFEPTRGFHAAVVDERLFVKGAPEVVLPQCVRVQEGDEEVELGDERRRALERRAGELAERGLRVLLIGFGPPNGGGELGRDLTAIGFVGISDPLRAGVQGAVMRCHEAGVRVIMLTGDHPATALTIARAAGLASRREQVITGGLDDETLEQALETATVIARVTPLDKVRIIERLQQRGRVVAMTGDGVNDAPALRLADAGVAMGEGTEVAREAADVVLADDNFATLVEALVEGRGFWQNLRRALGLLLGGNLGEIGLIVTATLLGRPSPLTARQILAVNLVTDVLPAVAVAVQPPEHRDLSNLAREGLAALDKPLRHDVLRRGFATAVPSLASTFAIAARGDMGQAQTAAFGSIVATQLAQTWQLRRRDENAGGPVAAAIAGSVLLMVAATTLPPLRRFLGLTPPTTTTTAAIAAAALAAMSLARRP
jgi:cation-transporting P-type ATPase I